MTSGFGQGLDNQTREVLNRWRKPGDITKVPRVGIFMSTGERTSSRWLYDGSYIRLRQLSLGYNLPATLTSKLKISGARVYVAAANLWTVTDYISDPEVNTLGTRVTAVQNITGGTDFYTVPQPRTFSLGVNVRF